MVFSAKREPLGSAGSFPEQQLQIEQTFSVEAAKKQI